MARRRRHQEPSTLHTKSPFCSMTQFLKCSDKNYISQTTFHNFFLNFIFLRQNSWVWLHTVEREKKTPFAGKIL